MSLASRRRTIHRTCRRAALLFALTACWATGAEASCTLDRLETCTLTDPSATERLLFAALEEQGTNPTTLYGLGYYYWNAPGQFGDPVKGRWYLDRAVALGSDQAQAFLDALAAAEEEASNEREEATDTPPAPAVAAEPIPPDPPSTLTGTQLSIEEVMTIAYEAGFRSEDQLLPAVATAIAESSLWSAARNWKPELGYRPMTDAVLVTGPGAAWDDGRQMHADRGLWQLSSFTWARYGDHVTDDPLRSAMAAFVVSKRGTDFFAWDSFVGGRAQLHYDRAVDGWPALRPIVQDFLHSIEPQYGFWEPN